MMKNAAMRITARIATAPPIIPPISGVVRPESLVPVALTFSDAV